MKGLYVAARNALKRKKQHEHSLEQTNGQISMLEQQIYSIESANINQETLVAMKNAGKAMKEIHGKMTMEDVDTTMYISSPFSFSLPLPSTSLQPPFLHLQSHLPLYTPRSRNQANGPQGTTPRTTRTNAINRQRHNLHAYIRTHRRRRARSRPRSHGTRETRRADAGHGHRATR